MDRLSALNNIARKRGLYWPSYEIYGGVAGFYDYGPIGVSIKNKIMHLWRMFFVEKQRGLVVEIETPIITPREVLKASGHEEHFTDPYTYCKKCGNVYRVDHLIKEALGINVEGYSLDKLWEIMKENNLRCPKCGGELSKPENALLLFKTTIGPYRGAPAYFRPETAQGIFVSFKNVHLAARERFPLGIAQVGRVGRNEISPRQGMIRLREFTIMEVEFFFDPEEPLENFISEIKSNDLEEYLDTVLRIIPAYMRERGEEKVVEVTAREAIEKELVETPWLAYWMSVGTRFLEFLGIPSDKIRFIEKLPHEKAHYAAQTFDQEVYTEKYGWIEVAGYAYRTNYDLSRHIKYTHADLTVFKRYKQPIKRKQKVVTPNIMALKRDYPEKFPDIMKKLSSYEKEELLSLLENQGYIEINGVKITRKYFIIKEKEQYIHGEKIIPHVVEPSFGLERIFYAVLENSLKITDKRTWLGIKPWIAPYDAAVFPLVSGSKKEHKQIEELAKKIYYMLLEAGITAIYDSDGSIGRRYARADEIGIPVAITVDYQSLKDNTVTIRDRDTQKQLRVNLRDLYDSILQRIKPYKPWSAVLEKYLTLQ